MTTTPKKKKFNILFVCTGNTCRSPMAECMFKQYLKEKKRSGDFCVSSAGLAAVKGDVMSANAHGALEFFGVRHDPARKARLLTVNMTMDADLIVGMSDRHADACGDKAISFGELGAHRQIPDPFGGSLQTYIDCAALMRASFDDLLDYCDSLMRRESEQY